MAEEAARLMGGGGGDGGRGERDVVELSAKSGYPSRYYSQLGRKVPERGVASME